MTDNPYEDRQAYSDRDLEDAGIALDNLLTEFTGLLHRHYDRKVKHGIIEPIPDMDNFIADFGQAIAIEKNRVERAEVARGLRSYTAKELEAALAAAE